MVKRSREVKLHLCKAVFGSLSAHHAIPCRHLAPALGSTTRTICRTTCSIAALYLNHAPSTPAKFTDSRYVYCHLYLRTSVQEHYIIESCTTRKGKTFAKKAEGSKNFAKPSDIAQLHQQGTSKTLHTQHRLGVNKRIVSLANIANCT